MKIEELAKEKVCLGMRIVAIDMTNVYSMELEDKIKLEIDRIETMKRLNEVNAEIHRYENSNLNPGG